MDGSWEYAIKNAMKEFTDRVNATLPLDQPDYIQLALIQSQRDGVCGACPAGQSLAASGRCVGLPVTAQTVAARRRKRCSPGRPRRCSSRCLPSKPLPGRMAIGGPVPTSVDAQQAAPSVAPGTAATPLRTETAALETAPLDAAAVEPPVTAAPKAVRRSSSSRRVGRNQVAASRVARSAARPKLPPRRTRHAAPQSAVEPWRRLLTGVCRPPCAPRCQRRRTWRAGHPVRR